MSDPTRFRIGSRGSPLALWQANTVIGLLRQTRPEFAEPRSIELVVIKTTGDRVDDKMLKDLGGKGMFSKEIDEALLDGRIDLGIHSMKDLPSILPDGIALHSILPREDVRDAFISPVAPTLDALPSGSTVGTSSLRRRAQILNRRPDLKVVPIRGNVDTRLQKLSTGAADATLLALAGLKRLGKDASATSVFDITDMLPAVAQGALGGTCRNDDTRANAILAGLTDPRTRVALIAERAMLTALGGNCYTPVAGYAYYINDGLIRLEAILAHPDGTEFHRATAQGAPDSAEKIGNQLGAELVSTGSAVLIDAIKAHNSGFIPVHPEMEREN